MNDEGVHDGMTAPDSAVVAASNQASAESVPASVKNTRYSVGSRRPEYHYELVKFFANPAEARTQEQLANDAGVSYPTMVSYLCRHRQEILEAADKIRSKYLSELRSATFREVFKNIGKSYQDRALALRLTGDLVEQTKATLDFKTPEEKRAKVAELMAALSERLSRPAPDNKDSSGLSSAS